MAVVWMAMAQLETFWQVLQDVASLRRTLAATCLPSLWPPVKRTERRLPEVLCQKYPGCPDWTHPPKSG
jgi:hypothetical protein